MKKQLREWEGRFGDEYTERNVVVWADRLPLFGEMLGGISLKAVLEVGCNRGHNLVALKELLGPAVSLVGVEPNRHARAAARSASAFLELAGGSAYHLPFRNGSFDLVLTWGVLIHIPRASLSIALDEIHRVSRRYVLLAEYLAEDETAIKYRGHDDMLWKRNFPKLYREQFLDSAIVRHGYWGPEKKVDRVSWWLFEKQDGNASGV
jgi:pseudaminic acid biosynthesis-associated methylase